MAFTGSWNTAVDEGDRACKHERDEDVQDKPVLYRLMFSLRGNSRDGYVRASWERLDGEGTGSRWKTLCSGRGSDEKASIAALRDNLRALRRRLAEHRPMRDWQADIDEVVS